MVGSYFLQASGLERFPCSLTATTREEDSSSCRPAMFEDEHEDDENHSDR